MAVSAAAWLLFGVLVVTIAALWLDGGWRSSYYLASYAAIILAAVVWRPRAAILLGALAALGYVLGLIVNGYSWAELERLRDADSVIANTGGYLIAAAAFSAPIAWLGSYVSRINQVLAGEERERSRLARRVAELVGRRPAERRRTRDLTAREVQLVVLIADGLRDREIAQRLYLAEKYVSNTVSAILKKTGCRSRTELAVLAVREGLVPEQPPD